MTAWETFETLSSKSQEKARFRLEVLDAVETLSRGGLTKHMAVSEAARTYGVSARAVWTWNELVIGVCREHRLPYLAPRNQMARRPDRRAEMSQDAWEWFKAAYLRQGDVPFTACYDDLKRLSEAHQWSIPSASALRRKIDREIPRDVRVLKRQGPKAMAALYPAQTRDKSNLVAMELVNTDFHKFDVFVKWDSKILRPQIGVFQDVYSGKILSWRYAEAPNTATVQLAFGDMVETFGIPQDVLMDNGREYASKWFTGGAPTRFRGVIKDVDIWGTLPSMGINIHWCQCRLEFPQKCRVKNPHSRCSVISRVSDQLSRFSVGARGVLVAEAV